MKWLSAVLLTAWCCGTLAYYDSDLNHITRCYGDSLDISCPADSLLVVETAVYGRMSRHACGSLGKKNCFTNVQLLLKRKCSGRRECQMNINDDHLNNPCGGDPSYLKLEYRCAKRSQIVTQCNGTTPITLGLTQRYIMTPNYPHYYPQSLECRWRLPIPPGFRVNISFLDFELESRKNRRCNDFVTIVDTYRHPTQRKAKILFYDCGVINTGVLVTRQLAEEVLLRFVSRDGTTNRGFFFEYIVEERASLHLHNEFPLREIEAKENPSPTLRTTPFETTMAMVEKEAQKDGNNSIRTGIIIGVVGSAGALLIIAAIYIVHCRHKSTKHAMALRKDVHETLLYNNANNHSLPNDDEKGSSVVMEINGGRIETLHIGTPICQGAVSPTAAPSACGNYTDIDCYYASKDLVNDVKYSTRPRDLVGAPTGEYFEYDTYNKSGSAPGNPRFSPTQYRTGLHSNVTTFLVPKKPGGSGIE